MGFGVVAFDAHGHAVSVDDVGNSPAVGDVLLEGNGKARVVAPDFGFVGFDGVKTFGLAPISDAGFLNGKQDVHLFDV